MLPALNRPNLTLMGHTERMTQAVYGRVTDDRLTAASAVFSEVVGQS